MGQIIYDSDKEEIRTEGLIDRSHTLNAALGLMEIVWDEVKSDPDADEEIISNLKALYLGAIRDIIKEN